MEVAQTREERADLSHESVHVISLNVLGTLYNSLFKTDTVTLMLLTPSDFFYLKK